MLASSTRRGEEREEVLHGFWKTGGLPNAEQGFVEVKLVRMMGEEKPDFSIFPLFFPFYPGPRATEHQPKPDVLNSSVEQGCG